MFGRRRSGAVLDRDISEAGVKAVETVGELADRALNLAREAGQSDVTNAARARIADASERLADAVRPKQPKTHRIRRIIIVGAIAGVIVGLIRSPLRSKISERLFGPPAEDEPGSITLPYEDKGESADSIELRAEAAPPAPAAAEANGGSTAPTSETADTSRA